MKLKDPRTFITKKETRRSVTVRMSVEELKQAQNFSDKFAEGNFSEGVRLAVKIADRYYTQKENQNER